MNKTIVSSFMNDNPTLAPSVLLFRFFDIFEWNCGNDENTCKEKFAIVAFFHKAKPGQAHFLSELNDSKDFFGFLESP